MVNIAQQVMNKTHVVILVLVFVFTSRCSTHFLKKYDYELLVSNAKGCQNMKIPTNQKKAFLNDLNNLHRIDTEIDILFAPCFKLYVYKDTFLLDIIETDGIIYYEYNNQQLFLSDENLIEKYWHIREENACQ